MVQGGLLVCQLARCRGALPPGLGSLGASLSLQAVELGLQGRIQPHPTGGLLLGGGLGLQRLAGCTRQVMVAGSQGKLQSLIMTQQPGQSLQLG